MEVHIRLFVTLCCSVRKVMTRLSRFFTTRYTVNEALVRPMWFESEILSRHQIKTLEHFMSFGTQNKLQPMSVLVRQKWQIVT